MAKGSKSTSGRKAMATRMGLPPKVAKGLGRKSGGVEVMAGGKVRPPGAPASGKTRPMK